ncbi:MAG: hypothetical protein LBU57_06220 [Dysgonamonadaceae bacterium]|jgi:hypothetical protein|nr:hypothetical protein [Dysgonamonadaceae bacterium]
MKNLILVSLVAIGLFSCSSKQTSENSGNNTSGDTLAASTDIPVFELDSLLKVADQLVDKTVKAVGHVTHTCKHSGKRCFIVGESENASLRIEAKGNIGGFNRELVGSKIRATGTIKERRLSQEYIDQMEKEVHAKKEDGSAESCQAELNNINEMRQWMKDNNKDYYSIYYMDGQEYEILE